MDIKVKLYVTKGIWQWLIAVGKSKVTFTINKPAYAGVCILDLNKVLRYEFHYEYIKNKYGNDSRLLLIITDSLMYEITEDFSEDFSKDREISDFSNYSANYSVVSLLKNLLVWSQRCFYFW